MGASVERAQKHMHSVISKTRAISNALCSGIAKEMSALVLCLPFCPRPHLASCCGRYVVPLVFYHMLRRWTTVRPAVPHWPHRPLPEAEGGPAGGKGVTRGGAAELQQVLIVDGIARSTEVGHACTVSCCT